MIFTSYRIMAGFSLEIPFLYKFTLGSFMINTLFGITTLLCLGIFPLAFWDHLVPHLDATAEYEEHIQREADKAAARLFEQYRNELSAQEMQEEMDKWRAENGYKIWDEKNRRYIDPPKGCSVEAPYQGTCGPPDNGR